MNGQNRHVDGDDYTWGNAPSGRAVLKPTLTEIAGGAGLEAAGRYSLEDTIYDLPVEGLQAARDLRTADQRERDDVAALGNEIDTLRRKLYDQAGRLDRRIDALEAAVAKLGVQP